MRDIYENLPKLKLELTFSKVVVIVVTVFSSFILPAALITKSQQSPQNNTENTTATQNVTKPQVAGVSTSKDTSNTNLLIITGATLTGVSIILIIFLFADNYRSKKSHG